MELSLFPDLKPVPQAKPALKYKKEPNKKLADRRYYLHRVLKDKYEINAPERSIKVPYKAFADIPIGDRYYIGQLIDLGYNVQLDLL